MPLSACTRRSARLWQKWVDDTESASDDLLGDDDDDEDSSDGEGMQGGGQKNDGRRRARDDHIDGEMGENLNSGGPVEAEKGNRGGVGHELAIKYNKSKWRSPTRHAYPCVTPERFAEIFVEDLELDPYFREQFVPMIADAIQQQCEAYAGAAEYDLHASLAEHDAGREGDVLELPLPMDGDVRILIKLDLQIGTLHLRDQFEWPLYTPHSLTPEDFAKQLAADLGVGGEFAPLIAHTIREQVCEARQDPTGFAPKFRRALRALRQEGEFGPRIRELSGAEVGRIRKERERE
ncbi:Chromatin structure remodeling complex protein sfh1, partial [Dinochytrium kinnereticum]